MGSLLENRLLHIKKVLKTIVVNVIVFFFLLFLVNLGCGYYLKITRGPGREQLPNYKENVDYGSTIFSEYNQVKFNYEAFVGWRSLPFKGITTNINSRGLRYTKNGHGSDIASGKSRLVRFFGGSTMWGEGSDDQHTIPSLYAGFSKDTVVNHAQLAYNSRQNLDALISLINEGDSLDLVIFYDGVNDASFLCPSEIHVPGHRLVPMFQKKIYVSYPRLFYQVLHKLFLENIIRVIQRNNDEYSPDLWNCLEGNKARDIARFMISNWEIANELVKERGGKFIAVLQPVSFRGNPRLDHLKLDEELGRNIGRVYEEINILLNQKNYDWVIDLSQSFNGDDYIYIDFCHVSPNGNEIIAQQLVQRLNNLEF